jgi:TRAP-type mannitol/chloroaromatic compound transport system permease small subunit
VNAGGTGCVPSGFACESGYEINPAGTACIPVPGTPIPFPFLFLTICCGITVAASYMKEKCSTKVKTCLIWMITLMEPIQYALLAAYSLQLEQFESTILAFAGLGVLLLTNLLFLFKIRSNLIMDEEYNEWCRLFPKGPFLMPLFTLINFKSIRFIFSGFFSWDIAEARFSDPVKHVHNALKTATTISYILIYVPELMSALLILKNVSWGE